MINISNFDKVEERNFEREYEKFNLGYQECIVKKAYIGKTQDGKDRLVLEFDINSGENKGYFQRQYDNDTSSNKYWRCNYYPKFETEEQKKFFKGMMTSFEKSNPSLKWTPQEQAGLIDESRFVGMIVGAEFILREYEYNGEVRTKKDINNLRSITSDHSNIKARVRLLDGKYVDYEEYIKGKQKDNTSSQTKPTTEIKEEDLPF